MGDRRLLPGCRSAAECPGVPEMHRSGSGPVRPSDRGDPLARRPYPRRRATRGNLRTGGLLLRRRAVPQGVPGRRRCPGQAPPHRRRLRRSGNPSRVLAAEENGVEAGARHRQPPHIRSERMRDLSRPGWRRILASGERPAGLASVFKVPHHGSEDAHEPEVWKRMLVPEPFAVLAPWRKGRGHLPRQPDVRRLRSCTPNAYATAKSRLPRSSPARSTVKRTIRESGVELRRTLMPHGCIRLRRRLGATGRWEMETFGTAYRLTD